MTARPCNTVLPWDVLQPKPNLSNVPQQITSARQMSWGGCPLGLACHLHAKLLFVVSYHLGLGYSMCFSWSLLVQWDTLTFLLKVPSYLMHQIDQFEILNFKSHLSSCFWLLTPKFWEVVRTYELSFCLKMNAAWVVWTIISGEDTQTLLSGIHCIHAQVVVDYLWP